MRFLNRPSHIPSILGGRLPMVLATLMLLSASPVNAAITLDTTTATDWKISNGRVLLDWNSTTGHVFSVHLAGQPDEFVDVTNTSGGQPKGLYMDNTGLGPGTATAGFHQEGNRYLDWWITTASNANNPFTYSQHFIITDDDPGWHVYFVVNHSTTDIAGSLGQIQFVFRINQSLFTNTYSVDAGLNNLGPEVIPLPAPPVLGTTDPGRQVQDATVDLHGLTLPSGFGRQFYTKYDYSTYEYLHRAHGLFGSTYGAWVVIPNRDSLVGGPTKQDLIFTGTIIIMECQSNHLDNGLPFNVPQGTALNRIYGPFYYHLNAFDALHTTPGSLFDDALDASRPASRIYDSEDVLIQNGYVASFKRGAIDAAISGVSSLDANKTWIVLGDNNKNFQYSDEGHQYWMSNRVSETERGRVLLRNVVPGIYRFSAYVLGEWGELRADDTNVTPDALTTVHLIFRPENFGTSPPIWTIGKPDRSAHEFLHGANSTGRDDREYWGNWNYWADFAAHQGAVVYNATAVGSAPATNDLSQWNYVQWHTFNPPLFAGIFDPSDDTTDGYKFLCPSYVGNCATAAVPDWQVHFTTSSAQQAQGGFVLLSVGLAATESNLTVSLNGHALTWNGIGVKNADAQVRSGLSGTYQWLVFQWNTSELTAAGADSVLTFHVDHQQGVMYDALRMEISTTSADHSVTGWNDYEFISEGAFEPANDAVSNNGH